MNRVGKVVALAVLLSTAGAMLVVVARYGGGTRSRSAADDVADEGDAYTVEMSPMGAVRFEAPPRRVVTLDAHYNDALVAFARQDGLLATGAAANFFDGFYAQLDGSVVDVDRSGLSYLYGQGGGLYDKETFYALDADVHHIDPRRLARGRGWSVEAVDEIARNVGPFFANRYSRTCDYPGDGPYEFYALWDLCQKVAEVHRQGARMQRIRAIGERMTREIEARLPPLEQRPRVGLAIYSSGRFLPFCISERGFGTAHYRAVGAVDAFASLQGRAYADAGRGTRLDLEAMLAIDPDVLIVPWAIYEPHRYEELCSLAEHPLGKRLRAVATGRLHPGGSPLQGPIFHVFQIEMAAKQIYPEVFGPFRHDHDYPPEEQLFSRDELARVLRAPGGGGR